MNWKLAKKRNGQDERLDELRPASGSRLVKIKTGGDFKAGGDHKRVWPLTGTN